MSELWRRGSLRVEQAFDNSTQRVRHRFPCLHCGRELTKGQLERLYETYFDQLLGKTQQRIKRKPVIVNYSIGSAKHEKAPDDQDMALLSRIEAMSLPPAVPTNLIPFMHMTHQRARMEAFGIMHIHQFYLPRAAQSLGTLWATATAVRTRACVTCCCSGLSKPFGDCHF